MRVLSIEELGQKGIRFSRTHIYRLIRKNEFPRPIRLGEQRVAFVEDEIDAWLRSKIEERDSPAEKKEIARRTSQATKMVRKGNASRKSRRAA
ncbi:helix-turn-helix transcriptional regulator [Methyloceanibacter caenitepidi]|uniref:Uncharacterized protein n=1 Tax=Methyloceanibacter caenitepidi TaxID=1384459 RepID=A0A0A8K5Y2_9HYPH|nr:AlpA family phage regulatory protein [Methyloceanibacter caenitepidi]BAQ17932.1 hypothetical protein GL4_2498 [Methyloceanibacter caenitepidi]